MLEVECAKMQPESRNKNLLYIPGFLKCILREIWLHSACCSMHCKYSGTNMWNLTWLKCR